MRPRSIATFEWLYLLAILLEVATIALHWSQIAAALPADRWARFAAVAVSLLLVLLTSRRRMRIAGIVLGALFVIGLPVAAGAFTVGAPLTTILPLALQVLLQVAAFVALMRPESRAWLSGRNL